MATVLGVQVQRRGNVRIQVPPSRVRWFSVEVSHPGALYVHRAVAIN